MRRIVLLVIVLGLVSTPAVFAKIGGGEIIFKAEGANDVLFSHAFHVQKKGLRCSECHNRIFIPKASTFNTSMAEIRKGQACGFCHNATRAFGIEGNCQRCHR